jgi:hypothetical protein
VTFPRSPTVRLDPLEKSIDVCLSALQGTSDHGSCGPCGFATNLHDDRAPVFFSGSPLSQRYRAIGQYYDDLYDSRTNVWEDYADRKSDSIAFMVALVGGYFGNLTASVLGNGDVFDKAVVSSNLKPGFLVGDGALTAQANPSRMVVSEDT